MTDHTPITLPQSAYSIKEAATLVGKSDITLVRWCRDGLLPNAGKVAGPKGEEWSIPASDLADIIAEKGLRLDLRDMPDQDPATDQALDRANQEVIELLKENAELREKTGHMTGQHEQLTARLTRLESDLEQAHTEWQRAATDRDRATGEADALRTQIETLHSEANKLRAEAVQERDSLDQKYLELQKESAESLSAASTDLETAAGERDELAAKLVQAEASMGWWTRRRYQK